MAFNDLDWRQRSAERMRAMQADPQFKRAQRNRARMRHRDQIFKQRCGQLTDQERSAVIAEIATGAPYCVIAERWLLSAGRVAHIAMEERRGCNSRSKWMKMPNPIVNYRNCPGRPKEVRLK